MAELAEIRESEVKTVLQGMLKGAAHVAQIRAGIAQGEYYPQFDPAPALIGLADLVSEARRADRDIDFILRQVSVLGTTADEAHLRKLVVEWLAALQTISAKGRRRLSAQALGDTIVDYCKLVKRSPANVDDMWASSPPTDLDLIAHARAEVEMRKEGDATAQEVTQEAMFNGRRRRA